MSDRSREHGGRLHRWYARVHRSLSARGLRTRVALLVAAAVGFAVLAAAAAAYLTVRHQLRDNLDNTLVRQAAADVQVIERAGPGVTVVTAVDVRVMELGADGTPYPLGRIPLPPYGRTEVAVAQGLLPRSLRSATSDGQTYRVAAVQIQPGRALVLASSTASTDRELHNLALVLVVVGLAGMAVAGAAGLVIARAGLRPVDRLTAAAEHVAATQDLAPIPVRGHDELSRLTASFNQMLLALDRSQERQRQLVADASHELRTPLTSLRTNIDLLTQAERSARPGLGQRDRDELLDDVRAQLTELSALVGDLVELARTDPPELAARPLDFALVVGRAVERARRRAPEVNFELDTEPWQLAGDPATLERAVLNLLDNAAKWSPPGSTVTTTLHGGRLEVADQGPGISTRDLPHVFDRFYRAGEARGLPGSGLGLAIVREVTERHRGSVAARTRAGGGAVLTMRLPGRPAQPMTDFSPPAQ